MANEIRVTVDVDGRASDSLRDVEDQAGRTSNALGDVGDSAGGASDSLGDLGDSADGAGSSTEDATTKMAKMGAISAGLSSAIGDAGDSLQSLVDFQNKGSEQANELARAQADVTQAQLDGKQAVQDLAQAQQDATQAQGDAKQGALDLEKSQNDLKQAQLDAQKAQKDYNTAVKEHGRNSVEAKQALIDLASAQSDVKQATLDGEQATRDISQAKLDEKQATQDAAQATQDGRSAQLDLNEAMSAAHPSGMAKAAGELQAYAAVVAGATGVVELLAMAYNAVSISAVKSAVSTAAAKVATIAGSVATGIATAAQWLWNIALSANPIGIVILAIAALVAAIVWIATKTNWFQTAWKASWNFVKDAAHAVGAWFSGPFVNFFRSAWNVLLKVIRTYVLFVVDSFGTILRAAAGAFSWVPGIGGRLKAAEKAFQSFRDSVNRSLGGIQDKHVNVTVDVSVPRVVAGGHPKFMSHGGIATAASGKAISGLTAVGEHGIELLDLPAGSRVRSNPDSMEILERMAAGAGRGIQVVITGGTGTTRALLESLKAEIKLVGGTGTDSVQRALGFQTA